MIRSFWDRRTAAVWAGLLPRSLDRRLANRAREKLAALARASTLEDLARTPGHRLEKLGGDRVGTWSIRVDRQWRICFRWEGHDAYDVELVDYH